MDSESEEVIIEQLGDCEQKLVSLVEELGSRDLDTIQKEMEDEEVRVIFVPSNLITSLVVQFRQTIEGGASANIRITLPKEGSQGALYGKTCITTVLINMVYILTDESDSDDEDNTRELMKRDTQQLVESKTKKKPQDDDEEEDKKGKGKRR